MEQIISMGDDSSKELIEARKNYKNGLEKRLKGTEGKILNGTS